MSSPSSNVITLTDNSGSITSITYVTGSATVTTGESYTTPPAIQRSGSVFTITFDADRKGSTSVAGSFDSASGGAAYEYAASGGGGTPDELNFFFTVQLAVETSQGSGTVLLNIAQGHYGTTNNWWLGGTGIDSGAPSLSVEIGSGLALVLPLSGTNDTYTLSAGKIVGSFPIRYVFVLMLENHSFDNIFAMSGISGISGATTSSNNSYDGTTYYAYSGAPLRMPTDPGHEFTDTLEQLAGAGATYPRGGPYPPIDNSGFVANYATTTTEGPIPSAGVIGDIMACFDTPSQLPVLYQLATEFVVCDRWFASMPGPTWPNRFFLHGASSNGLDHSPSTSDITTWETVDGFGYPNGSIFDALRNSGISYRLYNDAGNNFAKNPSDDPVGGVAMVSALKNIFMTSVDDVMDLPKHLASGNTARYTFIEPNYGSVTANTYTGGSSQHPKDGVHGGERLIQFVYESIRNSPLWDKSLLIVTYDEHGGFYDSVAPGSATPPGDGSGVNSSMNENGFAFDTLGVRVPAVVISPWVGKSVDTTIYDHTSVLATLEKLLDVAPLTKRDANAKDVLHLLQDSARTDCPTTLAGPTAPAPVAKTTARIDPSEPLPKGGVLSGMLGIALKTEFELSDGSAATKAELLDRFKGIQTVGQADAYLRAVVQRARAERPRGK